MTGRHDFLVDAEYGLSRPARQLPLVREHIEGLPETKGTFMLTDIDGVQPQFFEPVHVEFVKSWPVHEIYDTADQRSTRFVNPNYVHAHTFTDLVVECACGAEFTRNYEDGRNALQKEHEHHDDCMAFHRLRARAEMLEQRYAYMQRLGWLGWKGTDIAPRIGSQSDYMGPLARDFNLSLRDCYDKYREAAGMTYKHLVVEHGEDAEHVAEVYGHARSTILRWAKEYTDYETKLGRNQHTS